MTISYPSGLPMPLRADYGLQHTDNVLRTALGNGHARKEILHAPGPTRITAKFRIRPSQAQVFEGFYWRTLNSGVLTFSMLLLTPLGIQQYDEVEFAELYTGPTPLANSRGGNGRLWEFTAQLQMNRPPIISAEEAQFPDEVLYSSIFDRNMNRDWPPSD
ncbi:hypothetical protein [Vreelandella olivaria]|uniref:hypothetical protein n=1 Tax=Vreelandella olivaria TaxID=390919 RepID=UPI00201F0A83|nr:hypothetical protein [Halomonas olivaria]